MLRAIILTLTLATFSLFHSNVRPAFYLPCLLAMLEEASLKVCLAGRQTGFFMECRNTKSVELENVRKKWFEYVFLFIVRYFSVVCIGSSQSALFIMSLSTIFYTIDDILKFQEGFQFPFFDAGFSGAVVG